MSTLDINAALTRLEDMLDTQRAIIQTQQAQIESLSAQLVQARSACGDVIDELEGQYQRPLYDKLLAVVQQQPALGIGYHDYASEALMAMARHIEHLFSEGQITGEQVKGAGMVSQMLRKVSVEHEREAARLTGQYGAHAPELAR